MYTGAQKIKIITRERTDATDYLIFGQTKKKYIYSISDEMLFLFLKKKTYNHNDNE